MQITKVCDQSQLRNAVGSSNIRQKMSDDAFILVHTASMTGYHYLSDFESCVTVRAPQMGHIMSEVRWNLDFHKRPFNEYTVNINKVSEKISNLRRQWCG